MPVDPALRALNVTLPTSPGALLALGAVMERPTATAQELAAVIEDDLALAAAVVRTVNSAMFGLLRRVETVAEAVRYLGLREVAAITFEAGLRSRFAPLLALECLWLRARRRGLLMGRAATALGWHGWRAHSCGLFAEVGQAVLLGHDAARAQALHAALPAGASAADLAAAERAAFGVDHAALGAALCRAWGLAGDVATFVHERPLAPQPGRPASASVRQWLALGALADAAAQHALAPPEAHAAGSAAWAALLEADGHSASAATAALAQALATLEASTAASTARTGGDNAA